MNEELINILNDCLQLCRRLRNSQIEGRDLASRSLGGELGALYMDALAVSSEKIEKLEARIYDLLSAAAAVEG